MKINLTSLVETYMMDQFTTKWYNSKKSDVKVEYLEEYNKAVKIFDHALKYIKNEIDKK